jgi:carboxypeptidase T
MKNNFVLNRFALSLAVCASLLVFSVQSLAAEYDKVVTQLKAIEAKNPGLVKLFELAKTDSGQVVLGARVNKVATGQPDVDKTAHLVVGTHHGNERLSVDVAMQFLNDIVVNMNAPTNSSYAKFQDQTFYVIPVLNIGGYNKNDRYEYTNKNVKVDPNRDYPDPCGNPKPFQLMSTKALAGFVNDKKIVGAVTIHGYIGTFTFPWGIYTNDTKSPDNSTFEFLGKEAVKENGYKTGTHTDVIYPTNGAFEDWAYYQYGVWVTLLEIANGVPDIKKDSQTLLRYFSNVPAQRSAKHVHLGQCTGVPDRSKIRSRP